MVTICDLNNRTPKIDYPINWQYKLIIATDMDIKLLTKEVLGDREHTIQISKNSTHKKYKSYNVEVLVMSDDDRHALFKAFKTHKQIKFVL